MAFPSEQRTVRRFAELDEQVLRTDRDPHRWIYSFNRCGINTEGRIPCIPVSCIVYIIYVHINVHIIYIYIYHFLLDWVPNDGHFVEFGA